MGNHKCTTLRDRSRKRQRARGRPRKKTHWKEKRRQDALNSQQNGKDKGRDDNVEIDIDNDNISNWGGDSSDNNDDWGESSSDNNNGWGDIHEQKEIVVTDATQSLCVSLDRRVELVNIIYKLVHKCTGMIGGNGHGAAMYGEMVQSSMQRVVEQLISDTGLSTCSRFLDVGCGLGKPQLHVAQMTGVEFSYGIDIDELQVFLANLILRRVMKEARTADTDINTKCLVMLGDIEKARVFDPFTHVYMFDVA